jgi:starch synthase
MVAAIGKSIPLVPSDLQRLLRSTSLPDDPDQGYIAPRSSSKYCAAHRINVEALSRLHDICLRTGELYDLDVEVAAHQVAHRTRKSIFAAYEALKAQKRQGLLEDVDRATELTEPLAARLSDPKLPKRIREHIYGLAAKELLENVTDPDKDELLRSLLAEKFGGRTDAPPADMTLRERNQRQTVALTALLYDPRLSEPLSLAVIGTLARTGGPDAIEALNDRAESGATETIRSTAKAAIGAIQKSQKMTIVLASFEVKPYAGTGGLGNVMAELPRALAKMGHRVIVISPRHTMVDRNKLTDTGLRGNVEGYGHGNEPFQVLKDVQHGVENYFIENDRYFSAGRFGIYGDGNGSYGDNWKRFDFFSAAIPLTIKRVLGDEAPDIVQLNDAHTGPAAAYIKAWGSYFEKTKTIMAIHNLNAGYQQIYGKDKLGDFCFSGMNLFWPTGPAEFHDQINLMKLGLTMSDAAITVSRQYKNEILTDEHGEGLQGVLREIDARGCLWGNLNGIDNKVWNPQNDSAIEANYSFVNQDGKAACKAALQAEFGLPELPNVPLVGALGRLADQKGWPDVIGNVRRTLESGKAVQYVLMGDGDAELERQIRELVAQFPDKVAFAPYAADKEHRFYAGSDFFLMPSKFEPCGLPQLYALRYLTVPIVRAVGGLEESIRDWNPATGKGNGFKFTWDIDGAVNAALDWYAEGEVARQPLLRNCALADFSWERSSAVEQAAFYREMLNI